MNCLEEKKVSIYISTCNRLEKLKRAIGSVLSQDYSNVEILICDDASTDGTQEYMNALVEHDSRFIYLRNEVNKGACATRNLGIFAATGYFITGLDDDDEFASDRVSFFIKNWNDKYSFSCCNFENKYLGSSKNNYSEDSVKIFSYKTLLYSNEATNQIFTLTERLKSINGFDPSVRRLQDWDTWLRLSNKYGEFIRFPEVKYTMYHDHDINEARVSKSYSFFDALNDMRIRNANLYSERESKLIGYIVSLGKGRLSFLDLLKWIYLSKKPQQVAKMLYHYSFRKRPE